MSTGTLNSILGVDADNIERHGLGPALGVLLAISTVSGPFLSIVHRLYIPVGMMYEAAWWSIGLQVTQAFAQICAALLGATIFEAALLFSFLQAAAFIGTALYLRHRVPELVPWWRDRDLKTGIYDFFRSLLLSVNGAGQQATTSGVVLLVSSMFGASFVPMFATVKTLSNVWTGLGTVFASPLLPEVVRFHGTKEHHKLFMAFRAHWFFSGLVVNGSMIVLLPFIPTFYAIWTHRELSFENALFLCSLASVSLINFGAVLNVYLSGINSLAAQLVTTSVRAVVIFALGAALIPRQGMAGLGVSLLVAEIVCSVGLAIYFSNRELARFEVRLPWTSIGLALLQTLPVQLLAMESLIAGRVRPMSCVVAAAGLTLVAWVSWKGLDPDVKTRILHVLRR
jgi:O-antigen/teichoic acid export membrane protein